MKSRIIDENSAAQLLLSVSPILRPKQEQPSITDPFVALADLADLACSEAPLTPLDHRPHSCPWILTGKFGHIYNKSGRVGIYTKEERSIIIERFIQKRTRRNWNKKIRYGCRKNLADKRVRVKGRFVKDVFTDESIKEDSTSDPTLVTEHVNPSKRTSDTEDEVVFEDPNHVKYEVKEEVLVESQEEESTNAKNLVKYSEEGHEDEIKHGEKRAMRIRKKSRRYSSDL